MLTLTNLKFFKIMKVLVLFGSSTGNTEELANTVAKTLQAKGMETDLINIADTTDIEYDKYDFLFLGTSTWDEGQTQLDFRFYLEDLQNNPPKLEGKRFAVFGTGESCYEFFCGGTEKLAEEFKKFGGIQVGDILKIDTLEEDPVENQKTVDWTNEIIGLMF